MTKKVITIPADYTMKKQPNPMTKDISAAPIVNQHRDMEGIITSTDLIALIALSGLGRQVSSLLSR